MADPSFELLEQALADISSVCHENGKDPLETIVEFLNRRFAETLACDVRLPPVTTIRKGCKISILMTAIRQRASYSPEDLRFSADQRLIELKAAFQELIVAVERDANDPDQRGISGYLSARLTDAKNVLEEKTMAEGLAAALKACGVDE